MDTIAARVIESARDAGSSERMLAARVRKSIGTQREAGERIASTH